MILLPQFMSIIQSLQFNAIMSLLHDFSTLFLEMVALKAMKNIISGKSNYCFREGQKNSI